MKTPTLVRFLTAALMAMSAAMAAQPPNTGGPDGFGYRYIDSRAAGGPQYNFIDIAAPGPTQGALSTVTGQLDAADAVDIGFTFRFYDNEYTDCFIATHGFLRFASPSQAWIAVPIPTAFEPNNIIAGFWTDLDSTAPTGSGSVYYKTIGAAPDRKFIVQYNDVSETASSNKQTFQIQLFEGSNRIEIHYKSITARILDAGGHTKNHTIGLENAAGNVGLQYLHGDRITNHSDIPGAPFAVRFTRPVVVQVESEYGSTKVLPNVGSTKVAYQSLQRFEAPEFIYLNKDKQELNAIGGLPGDGSNANEVAYYRARNLGYAIDGETVQGVDRFFERTITRDMKVIWKWELEYAAFVELKDSNGVTLPGGIGSPVPTAGRYWAKKDEQFSATVDRVVGQDPLGLDISGFRYAAQAYQLNLPGPSGTRVDRPAVAVAGSGNRVATENVIVSDWLRVAWTFAGQVRYRFDAATLGGGGGAAAPLPGQAFVRTFNKDNPATAGVDESLTQQSIIFGPGATNEAWVDLGRKTQVGSFYRTVDRRWTLRDFTSTPSGDLALLSTRIADLRDLSLNDGQSQLRVARVTPAAPAGTPTEIHFVYEPTVFRAEVPLGQSFDAQNPDLQLIPALSPNGVLRMGSLGPADAFMRVSTYVPDGTGAGSPTRWDELGKRLLPVHPGSYQIDWPDANDPARTYKIEIVTGYPTDSIPLVTARENGDGSRQNLAGPNDPPNYVFATTMPAADASFPGAPLAHYRHHYSTDAQRTPPTKLDPSTTDHWKFAELSFTDRVANAAAASTAAGVPFTAQGTGRCVLLYRYRPNPDEIADGTVTAENLAVRVVNSTPVAPINPDHALNPLGRRGLELGSGAPAQAGALGVISRTGATVAVNSGANFAFDFWLNTKTLPLTGGPVTILSTGSGKLEVILNPVSSTITAKYFGLTTEHPVTRGGSGWSHYVIHVFGESFFGLPVTLLDFYADGVRDEDGYVSTLMPGGHSANFNAAPTLGADSLKFGINANPEMGLQLDQIRLYGNLSNAPQTYLSPGEVRNLRQNRSQQLRSSSALVHFSFESNGPSLGSGSLYSFANDIGTVAGIGIGPKSANDPDGIWPGFWARIDVQEVATRIDSALDDAGFKGTGYLLNRISNYNASLYNRNAEIGTWGPLFPVNDKRLFTNSNRRLEVAYYENPYRRDKIDHPNVAWPYIEMLYEDVSFPVYGPHKSKAIYIASRIGSEGVDTTGKPQTVFDLSKYAGLSIYNQPDRNQPGFNPNEEHALAAASGRAALKLKNLGDGVPNNPPLAAFALQTHVNNTSTSATSYTSHAWVLVQVSNTLTGEPEMAAYQVLKTRTGSLAFPRPADSALNGTGLSYESAANPEDRFLLIDPTRTYSFSYQFDYPVFAGDLLIPPYPLNIVIGNVAMADARGGNIEVSGVQQRTLWNDVNNHAWVVSGGGRFFHQFFYPFRNDFYFATTVNPGTPVAWLPDDNANFTGNGATLQPVKVKYSSAWRADYPKLKRGESLTYLGGEYFNENPGSNGLPALVAMGAAELVFDSSTPSMVYASAGTTGNTYRIEQASARIIRPLDRREYPFTVAQMQTAGFSPASPKIFVVAERWYFKDLPGSLQKRLYFDSLAQKLVFRGYLNDKESGDPDLTAGPDPINTLEPNVMTGDDWLRLLTTGSGQDWGVAMTAIYIASLAPDGFAQHIPTTFDPIFLAGTKPPPAGMVFTTGFRRFYNESGTALTANVPDLLPLDSFGVGSALVPNPSLLTRAVNGKIYVTIAENNRSELDGAPISLHVIEILPDRYRGAIKVIEAADAFSEKITLQHNGEFGGNTGDLYYEWWIRDAAPLDLVAEEVLPNGTLKETDGEGRTLWQQYIPQDRATAPTEEKKHLGLHSIVFEGRPDVVLADKLVLMRYRHRTESNWRLVPFEFTNPAVTWKPGTVDPAGPAPFQWAGAANSPQLQADGSKRYIPQLIMGWVKRVLDRINPYEARYSDFFNNESPATYSSQIQIAGGPFAGKVALNPAPDVIENTGLIELYETVLARARELSIDNSSNPVASDGINQALLLAATRLSILYELLAREAYSDAQDSTILTGEDGDLASVAPYTHAFQGLESDLLNEEMALLRGTDFRKSYPVYNRMFWNYTKGLGEAAYNVNYNIYDANTDGFINEDDGRKLFPQGHGDSWGHYLSALGMHYTLLQHPNFTWRSRSELYSLMQNVLEVDYLDEKTFAKLAAGKARAGRDIVRGTYRLNYTQDPSGQWQGYTDGADPARAWGVSEWAHRSGQGAYFDWAVANAVMPEDAGAATPVDNPENLDRIERLGAVDEVSEIAAGLYEVQTAMDEANGGVNPLGFDSDAITFDIDPTFLAVGSTAQIGTRAVQGLTHYEQIFERALAACKNAVATLGAATAAENKLRKIGDDTDALIIEAIRQDLDYRNRLIEIFGTPYTGTIGFGKAYPEGYLGPDTRLYAYLDETKISEIVPQISSVSGTITFNSVNTTGTGLANNATLSSLYNDVWGSTDGPTNLAEAFKTLIGNNTYQLEQPNSGPYTAPYQIASKYGFQAPTTWGQRVSHGKIQVALEEMLQAEIALDSAIADYIGFLQDWEVKVMRLQSDLEIFAEIESLRDDIDRTRKGVNGAIVTADTIIGGLEIALNIIDGTEEAVVNASPSSIGFSNDVGAIVDGIAGAAAIAAAAPIEIAKGVKEIAKGIAELARDEAIADKERDILRAEQVATFEGNVEELVNLSGGDQPKRDAVGAAILELKLKRQEFFTAQAEGFRLMREREAFNKVLAAKVQKNRYQDMIVRLSRNEVMSRYQSSFNLAARYTWLAAKAYDYETSLDPGHPAAATQLFDQIVKTRQLGLWVDGVPTSGKGGLGEILAQLNGNFVSVEGQIGLNSVQIANEEISLRAEHFRIGPPVADGGEEASDARWTDALKARIVDDLNSVPEFRNYCRPFADPSAGAQPGMLIRFSTTIEPGKNFFGRPLAAGDHAYSSAAFATRIATAGVYLDNYEDAELATTPRAYLVPVGTDYFRVSTSTQPVTRAWSVRESRIPTPFVINASQLQSPGFIPLLDGSDGRFGEIRRHSDFRMYHEPELDLDDDEQGTRLIARSIWNSEWILVIPGAGLHADAMQGLTQFAENVSDIKLTFKTYSHNGQ